VGLATGLLGQLGQGVSTAATRFAEAASAPFQAILTGQSSPPAEKKDVEVLGKTLELQGFAGLYPQFENAIHQFLAKYPNLPKLRIQISDDSRIRLQPAESADLNPEMVKRLAEIEDAANKDHDLSQLANQLYESKSLERWRSGLTNRPADVELIVPAAS
jgi:hypothetical protein